MMCKTWIAQKHFLIALFFLSLLMVGGHSALAAAAEKNEAQLPIAVHGDSGLPGKFYLSFVFDRTVILLDGKGNVVWSKHEEQKKPGGHNGFWDFKKTICDGKTYYSYHDASSTDDNFGLLGYAPGERVIMDENFREIDRVRLTGTDTVKTGDPVDGHDFIMLAPGHYIMSSYRQAVVENIPGEAKPASVVYSYLQEVKDHKVIWEWKSIDYPELYALTTTDADASANDFANAVTEAPDYMHFNSMQLTEDGNLLCSFRHLNTVMKLDRRTGGILWKLSGNADEFGLTPAQKTSSQHYVRQNADGYITAFDNGNASKSTRIVAYKLDEKNKEMTSFKSYALSGKFSVACGSAQRIRNETYLIGWGWATKDNECMCVYDFAAGKKLFSVTLKNPKNITYRCAYYE